VADRRISRRRVLAASVPAAVGLAGCSGGGDGGDGTDAATATPGTTAGSTATDEPGTTETDETETTATGPELAAFPDLSAPEPSYRRWQPGTGDVQATRDAAHNFGYAREFRSDLPARTYESATTWAMFNGYVGVEFDELDGMLLGLSSPAVVYLGSFARGDVTERLAGLPFERFETTDGVDYYRWDRGEQIGFVGVGDAAVVAGGLRPDQDDPAGQFAAAARPLFATGRGERPRLHEESSRYERYTDAVGWPLFAGAAPPRPARGAGVAVAGAFPGVDTVSDDVAESVRVGLGQYLAEDAVVERYWLWTTEDGPAGPADVRAAFDDPAVRRSALEGSEDGDLAVRRDGRVIEVAVLNPVSDPGGGADPPLVAAEATVDGGTLTLQHFGGDPLPLARVTVRGAGDPLSLGEGELSPGESASVELPDGADSAAVVYSPPAAEATTVIADV
jgi:hypothetical protein